jgi:hypothetical protein
MQAPSTEIIPWDSILYIQNQQPWDLMSGLFYYLQDFNFVYSNKILLIASWDTEAIKTSISA